MNIINTIEVKNVNTNTDQTQIGYIVFSIAQELYRQKSVKHSLSSSQLSPPALFPAQTISYVQYPSEQHPVILQSEFEVH